LFICYIYVADKINGNLTDIASDRVTVFYIVAAINFYFLQFPEPTFSRMDAQEKHILLLSTSTVYGSEYLQYAADDINKFLKRYGIYFHIN